MFSGARLIKGLVGSNKQLSNAGDSTRHVIVVDS